MEQQEATQGQREAKPGSFVGDIKNQVVEQAQGLAEQAQEVAESQKGRLAEGATGVAEALHHVSEGLRQDDQDAVGDYTEALAGQVEKVARFLQSRDLPTMARDVSSFARRQPALFLGGAFTLGIVAARFLKSSGSGAGPKSMSGGRAFAEDAEDRGSEASFSQRATEPLGSFERRSADSAGAGEHEDDARPDPALHPPAGVPPLPSAGGGGL